MLLTNVIASIFIVLSTNTQNLASISWRGGSSSVLQETHLVTNTIAAIAFNGQTNIFVLKSVPGPSFGTNIVDVP